MNYNYIPNSYNNLLVQDKFNNNNSFVNMQLLYRKGLENLIKKFIDFEKIDKYISDSNFTIPMVKDKDYNFYHKYSTLNSNYIYLRNNFHVENLTDDEIKILKENEILDVEFYNKTLERVIYEDGDFVFFGTPIDENLVKSKSIVFEFAYDQKKCTSLEQLKEIKQIIDYSFEYIGLRIKENMAIPISFIKYNAIVDIYCQHKEQLKNLIV